MLGRWQSIPQLRPLVVLAAGSLCTVAIGQQSTAEHEFVPGRLLIKFKSDVQPERRDQVIHESGATVLSELPQIGMRVLELPAGTSERAMAQAFKGRAEIEWAELDHLLEPADVPNDPYFEVQPQQLDQIHAPDAWALTTGNPDVVVAVLDSGIDLDHEDFAGKLVAGWNAYDNNPNVNPVTAHGTHVAGTVAAATDNGSGVASIAWNCKVMPVRVTRTDGWATSSAIAAGLVWAADHGARVANLSFDLTCCQGAVTAPAQYFQDQGGVVVSGAGNNGGNFLNLPDHPYLLAVTAVELDDTRAWWSSYGNYVDLAAPKSARTTHDGGGYASAGGTSIASPYVAGVAALMYSVNPSLAGGQVQDLLKQSADDQGPSGWDAETGWGRLNAAAAVELAMATTGSGSGDPNDEGRGEGTGDGTGDEPTDGDGGGADEPQTDDPETDPPQPDPPTDEDPPVILIQSPAGGSTVNNLVKVRVEVTDASPIDRVELYVDGVLTDTKSAGDFMTRWHANQSAPGVHVLETRAYDVLGNVGYSELVTVYK